MYLKKLCKLILVCAVTMGCLSGTAGATGTHYERTVYQGELASETLDLFQSVDLGSSVSPRASGSLNITIAANDSAAASEGFPLEVGETVTINCSYTPASASMDFGLVAPNGTFYYYNITDGSINKTIQVSERGYYTLAIRNNSTYSVSVTGYVNY